MPSIFKRPDSPYYVCSFVAADGRRLKKSTKTSDRRKALEFCLLLEKAAMKARRNELTAAQGRKLIAEMVTISSGEQMTAHTVRGWFEEWLSNKKASADQQTTARYRQVLNDFLTHLGSRADAPLTAISSRVIPLHPGLLDWLATQPHRGIGKACLFPALAGLRTDGRKGLSAQFSDIMRQAGVTGRASVPGGKKGRTRNSKSFHSLRHHFVSQLANQGVAPDIRQKLAGHSSAAVHGIYSHHELETLRAAVAKLPALGGARSKRDVYRG